jgi:hypothetical protein
MKTQLLSFAVLTFAMLSCSPRTSDDSDNRFDEAKDLSGVSKLKISGVFNLNLSQSDMESISIEGSKELTERLKISQEGDLLILELEDVKGGFFNDQKLEINLSISDLKNIEFEGVGNIKTQTPFEVKDISIQGDGVGNINMEIRANRIDAELNLMGNFYLKGKADRFNLENDGIGNIDASDLIAQNVKLISSGIGRVSVHCEGELSLEVSGIGEVKYTGNPKVIKDDVSGIGKVTRN